MDALYLCHAVGTPLDADDGLHTEGLRVHLDQQAAAGVDSVLVAGTMGAMPLLTHTTYQQLLTESCRLWRSRGELLVGVGDVSFARTKERIGLANDLPLDGAVVLTPFFLKYSQQDLIAYFRELAAVSRAPLYLYDLPQRTGNPLSIETVCRLAEHPNIRGIKCSGEAGHVRRLSDALSGSGFRVIVAQAPLLDILLKAGVRSHVDGVYSVVPHVVARVCSSAEAGDWPGAARWQALLNGVLDELVRFGVFPAATALLNAAGVPGNFAPRPHRPLAPEAGEELLATASVRAALAAVPDLLGRFD